MKIANYARFLRFLLVERDCRERTPAPSACTSPAFFSGAPITRSDFAKLPRRSLGRSKIDRIANVNLTSSPCQLTTDRPSDTSGLPVVRSEQSLVADFLRSADVADRHVTLDIPTFVSLQDAKRSQRPTH